MAKNGLKMVEFFGGASHMIKNNIFNIFCFSTFSLWYFLDPVFRAIFLKFSQNAGFVKYLREKVEKLKLLKMLLFIICEAPKKISAIFGHFYPISLDKFALIPKTRLPQFTRNQILTPTGK